MKIDWESFWEWFKGGGWRIVAITVSLILLLVAIAFVVDQCDKYRANKKIADQKAKIVNAIDQLHEANTNLAVDKTAVNNKIEEIHKDIEDLHKDVYGLEDAKNASNQALANYNKALQTNTNVDVTEQDLKDALKRLEELSK